MCWAGGPSTFGNDSRSDSLVRQLIPGEAARVLCAIWETVPTQESGVREIVPWIPIAAARIVLLGILPHSPARCLTSSPPSSPPAGRGGGPVDLQQPRYFHAEGPPAPLCCLNVIYGDISQRYPLAHAGVSHGKVIVCNRAPRRSSRAPATRNWSGQLSRELKNPGARIICLAAELCWRMCPASGPRKPDYVRLGRLS